MFDPIEFGREFFEKLTVVDATIAARVAASACSRCGGPLHVGNYLRKPRGGLLAAAGEDFALRFSLCCGREGCRRRTTPPSVRFLGRRVYLGAVVIFASAIAMAVVMGSAGRRVTGVPPRTLRACLAHWPRRLGGAHVARAADDGEHAGWSRLREGPHVTLVALRSTQRMVRALFSRAT